MTSSIAIFQKNVSDYCLMLKGLTAIRALETIVQDLKRGCVYALATARLIALAHRGAISGLLLDSTITLKAFPKEYLLAQTAYEIADCLISAYAKSRTADATEAQVLLFLSMETIVMRILAALYENSRQSLDSLASIASESLDTSSTVATPSSTAAPQNNDVKNAD